MHSRFPGRQQAQISMVGVAQWQRAQRGSSSVPQRGSGSRGMRSGASASPITIFSAIASPISDSMHSFRNVDDHFVCALHLRESLEEHPAFPDDVESQKRMDDRMDFGDVGI